MTTSFSRMSGLVSEGAIKVIELHAVPRSLSTALARCLTESGVPSVFINEPFNALTSNLEVTADYVLHSVEPALSQATTPVLAITKNIAWNVSAPVFLEWTDVCSALVWCVRDPRLQISSLVTRVANDLLFGIGSDRLSQADLLPSHLLTVTRVLQNNKKSPDFGRTGWRAIGRHFTDYAERGASFVADGSLLSRAPDRFLRYLCSGLGIEYRDGMINGWTQGFVNAVRSVNPVLEDSADAWVKRAATSRGIEAIDRAGFDVSILPPALRDHIMEVALPTYERFVRAFNSQENLAEYQLDLDLQPPRH